MKWKSPFTPIYDNPTGGCDGCQGGLTPGCCDENRSSSESCPSETCDTGMRVCIRRLSLSGCGIFDQIAPDFSINTNNFIFTFSFFGLDNPSALVDTAPWRVSLIHII